VFAIDPGTAESAFVELSDDDKLGQFGKVGNGELIRIVRNYLPAPTLAIEMVASYGMPVGREIFETCVWIGRFIEGWRGGHELIYRAEVKQNLCGTARAKDPNVRQALLDRWGGKVTAIGRKAHPGPLFGVADDVWAALGVAVTWQDRQVIGTGKGTRGLLGKVPRDRTHQLRIGDIL